MNDKLIRKCFVQQHDSSDCGVACLLMLLKFYGGDSTIKHLREISGTSQRGTTLLGLYQAAHSLGFKAEGAEANGTDDLIEHGKPTILTVETEQQMSHFITCFGYENGKFIIGDPAKGIEYYTCEQLEKIWTKKCLLLAPTQEIVKASDIKEKKRLWIRSLIRDDYGILMAAVVVGIIISILGMVMAVFSQKLVDDVLPNRDMNKLIIGLLLVFALLMARVLLSALRSRMMLKQGKDFNNRISDFFYSRILSLPKPYFDMRKVGDMTARLHDTRRIQGVVSTIFGDIIINLLVVIISIVFLAIYSWEVALISLACMPVYFIIIYRRNHLIISQQREVMAGYATTEGNFIDTIEGIADIKNYGRQPFFRALNQKLYGLFQDKSVNLGRTQIKIEIIAGIASVIIMLGLIGYASFLVLGDTLSIGQMMAVVNITGMLFPSVASLALVAIPLNEARVAFDRMFETINESNDAEEDCQQNNIVEIGIEASSLYIKNISFRFIGRRLLLKDISVTFKKGTITCIVGESGCGKSTLCQILERFYKPESGSVELDGIHIDDFSEKQWNGIMSVVPQDMHIFNGTILDNICLGELPENPDKIVEFCTKYGFDKFFEELPNGLATLAGEEGINLSGGQRQLLAFARALYKPSKILLLDEMTSAMDRRTEHVICELLRKLKENHIIIFVTHRLETARRLADNIYVIEDGVVSAHGSHDMLMKSSNFYSDYWHY